MRWFGSRNNVTCLGNERVLPAPARVACLQDYGITTPGRYYVRDQTVILCRSWLACLFCAFSHMREIVDYRLGSDVMCFTHFCALLIRFDIWRTVQAWQRVVSFCGNSKRVVSRLNGYAWFQACSHCRSWGWSSTWPLTSIVVGVA